MHRYPLIAACLILASCGVDEPVVRTRLPKTAEGPVAAPSVPAGGLAWTVPKGWTQTLGGEMRLATLQPPAGSCEVSVVALAGDGGGDLGNVNRWRGQLALPPISAEDLRAPSSLATPVGRARLYDFASASSPVKRMVAAVVDHGGKTWFFKLSGDSSAVAASRGGFVALLSSLRHADR